MLTVCQAHELILSSIEPLPMESVSLAESCDRVLALDVQATRMLPAWDNSAMDGYAVHHGDVALPGQTLPVVDAIPAGSRDDRPLSRGTAARIFTGAPLPTGADTVIIQENTERHESSVTFNCSAPQWKNVRRQGSDVALGNVVLKAGRALTPGDLSLLASLGVSRPSVHRRPIVHIAVTGNELVDVDGPEPERGQIVDGNALALAAAVRALGAEVQICPRIPDDLEATKKALLEATAGADLVITAGGASVGDHDYVGRAFRTLAGDDFSFAKVAVRPGKPIIHGRMNGSMFFGLPGNPVSALVTFEIFVRPALLKMMGHRTWFKRTRTAILEHPLSGGGRRLEYRRAAIRFSEGRAYVDGRRSQSSGALSSLGGADAFIVVPIDAPPKEAGEEIEILLLGPDVAQERFA